MRRTKIVDVLGHKIHIGDKILRASTWGHQGTQWSMHEVLGFTPKMIKIKAQTKWDRRETNLITPNNVIVIAEENYEKWKETKNAG